MRRCAGWLAPLGGAPSGRPLLCLRATVPRNAPSPRTLTIARASVFARSAGHHHHHHHCGLAARGLHAHAVAQQETRPEVFLDENSQAVQRRNAEFKAAWKAIELMWESDQTDAAIRALSQLVDSNPGDSEIIERLGDMHLAVGDYQASYKRYYQVVALLEQDPTRGLARWTERMSYLLVKSGESKERAQGPNSFDEAEAEYKKAIELNPKCVEAYHRLGFLNLKGDYLQIAQAAFDKGISNAGEHGLILAELWYGKGEISVKAKNWREAKQHYIKATEADSTYAPAFFKLGLIHQKNKDWIAAIQAYDQYHEAFEQYYLSHGVDAVDQRLESLSLLSDVMLRRAICYVEFGDVPVAMPYLDTVIDFHSPKFLPPAHLWRGTAHFKKADFWKAIDDFSQAINYDPSLPDAYLQRSTCYDIVGLTKEAEEDKQRYEQLKRAKSWEMRQAMLEEHFGPGPK